VHPDGRVIWVDVHGTVLYSADGTPNRFFGTSVDIIERKLFLEALKRSEEELRALAESMPQMAFIAAGNGDILYYTKKHYDYFAVAVGESENWGWKSHRFIHPEDLAKTVDRWTASLRTGLPYEHEYRLRRHDGVYRWHLARANPIRDTDGKIIRWFGTNTDIHESRELLEKLKCSEEWPMLATDASGIGIWEWNIRTCVVTMTKNECRILGLPDDQPRAV
jgi:PAS domain S-box-containing protein